MDKRRPPEGVVQIFAGGEIPVAGKGFHGRTHRRSLEPEMGVVDKVFRLKLRAILRPDIDTAQEGEAPIHQQQLAMVAHVQEGHAPGQPGVQEALGAQRRQPAIAAGSAPAR